MSFDVLHRVPDGFLDASVPELGRILHGPTVFDLPGQRPAPLFVSVLLHGNELTGLAAVQEVLRRHRNRTLPRRVLIFVGNVAAAAAGVRTLESQLDFNRAWPGTLRPAAPEAALMQEVFDYVADRQPFASIDIHNNTGLNPHYACLNRLDGAYLHLARLFSRTVVFFEKPAGVQSAAMARLCPAVTVECGKTGEASATAHAADFIDACLALSEFPTHPPQPTEFDLMRTFAIVRVPPKVTFSFDGTDADIRFRDDIDHLNFSEVAPGTSFGMIARGAGARLQLEIDPGAAAGEYFDYAEGEIRLARPAIPSMLTRDVRAVRADCLCYLMHRIDFGGRRIAD